MKSIFLAISMMAVLTFGHCQGYTATYLVKWNAGLDIGKYFTEGLLSYTLPINFDLKYQITFDGRFMVVSGSTEKVEYSQNHELTFNPSDAEVVIDVLRGLVYYPERSKLYRLKWYKVAALKPGNDENCDWFELADSEEKVHLTLCSNLPKYLFPGVMVSNTEFGMKTLSSAELKVSLIEWENYDGTTSWAQVFDDFQEDLELEEWSFFERMK